MKNADPRSKGAIPTKVGLLIGHWNSNILLSIDNSPLLLNMNNVDKWRSGGALFDFRGHEIFYRRSGAGKRTLLCLHGFPASSFDYHKIWDGLAEDFDVITFDLIGYGFSDKPPRFPYTTFDQADVLETFVEKLNVERFHVLAHDYGNTITQELLARSHESKSSYQIESICFLNGALFPETHRPIFAQKVLIGPAGPLFGRLIPEFAFRRSLASVFGPDSKPSKSELDDFMRLFDYKGGRRISHKLIRYMKERTTYRERWVAALKNMEQPFRFINGLSDPVSGRHLVTRFRQLVPQQTDIVELDNIGHFPHLEKPEAVLKHLREFHGL